MVGDDVYRPKKGFANPIGKWLRGSMRGFVDDCYSPNAVVHALRSPLHQAMVDDHESGRHHYLRHLYLLISFELWHRRFIAA